jgi:hypothetical protein
VTDTFDSQYYQVVGRQSIAERLLIAARKRIFRDFIAHMQPTPTDRILDVGVSDVVNDGANVLERSYAYQHNITACGLGDGVAFKEAYGVADYVRIAANEALPFADGSFEIATSNAVLEHVGSLANQEFFVRELCRVARRVFITVPNRYFPVEHHTALPLLHYNDDLFGIACDLFDKSEWAESKNLILMSRRRLVALARPLGRPAEIGTTGLPLGPFSSNLYLAVR